LQTAADYLQKIVEVVRRATSELADRFHLLRLAPVVSLQPMRHRQWLPRIEGGEIGFNATVEIVTMGVVATQFGSAVFDVGTGSEIEVHHQFAADQRYDFRNLRDRLPVFGVMGKAILRLGIGHPISILHDDHPLPDILAGLKAADPISYAVFQQDRFHRFGQPLHVLDCSTSVA
jgi:hypothetical protein